MGDRLTGSFKKHKDKAWEDSHFPRRHQGPSRPGRPLTALIPSSNDCGPHPSRWTIPLYHDAERNNEQRSSNPTSSLRNTTCGPEETTIILSRKEVESSSTAQSWPSGCLQFRRRSCYCYPQSRYQRHHLQRRQSRRADHWMELLDLTDHDLTNPAAKYWILTTVRKRSKTLDCPYTSELSTILFFWSARQLVTLLATRLLSNRSSATAYTIWGLAFANLL